jgi:hypothetical protein
MSGEPEHTEHTEIEEDPTAELSDAEVEDLEVGPR